MQHLHMSEEEKLRTMEKKIDGLNQKIVSNQQDWAKV